MLPLRCGSYRRLGSSGSTNAVAFAATYTGGKTLDVWERRTFRAQRPFLRETPGQLCAHKGGADTAQEIGSPGAYPSQRTQ